MVKIKEIVGIGCCILFSQVGYSQIKINANFATGNMNSNTAFLDGSSSNSWNGSSNLGKGLLFPRVDLTTLAAMSMAGSPSANNNPNRFDGMLVYNTGVGSSAIGSVSVTAGFYYYKNSSTDIDGGTWQPMAAIDLAGDISSIGGITTIGANKITTDKIADGTILGSDLSDGAVDLSTATVGGVLSTTKGGTGAGPLTGFVKGNGTAAFTTVSAIDIASITGAVSSVNGSIPDANGNVTVSFGSVTTGVLNARPAAGSSANGNIYVVSSDANAADNGRAFVSDGVTWAEITSNQPSTDARYLKLEGGIMQGNLSFPAGKMATVADAPQGSTDIVNKQYVDQTIIAGTADATNTSKGKIQLAGDLDGTAALPVIGANKITTDKIADGTILGSDLSDGAIDLSTAKVSGVLSTTKGGTGAASLTGFVKGNGTAAFTTVSSIDIAAVTGAVSSVNGSIPDANGNVEVAFGSVSTGTLSAIPAQGSSASGNIYVVSGDGANNGQTFINDGANWNQITSDQAGTDSRYVKLQGGTMQGNLTFPTGKMGYVVDAPAGSTDIANKKYVDDAITDGTADATISSKGKIQLAGDLAGTAIAPTVPGLALKATIDSPSFTGTVSGVTAAMVGLGNVDNTTDLLKPISTATQTALDDKEATANKSNNINADAASDVKFPSVQAVKTYVDASSSIKEIRTIITADTAASTDYILLCNTAGGAFTLNLPAASSQKGKIYIIRKTDVSSNALTINPRLTLGSEEVTGVNYPTTIEVVSDGTNWNVLN